MTTVRIDGLRIESLATRWAAAGFVGGAVVVILLGGPPRPLAGDGSLGGVAAWVAAAFSAVAFAVSFLIEERRGQLAWRARIPVIKRVVDLVATAIAVAALSYFIVLAVANVFQLGFIGLTVEAWGGGVLAGAAVAAVTFSAVLIGSRPTSVGVAVLATLVLFAGTFASMLSAPDQSWWQLHFSQLGNNAGMSGNRFNFSLIITGLVLTVLANYLGHDIERGLSVRGADSPRKVRILTWLFAGIGVCMMIVGLVPDAVAFPVHVGAGSGMVVVFAAFSFYFFGSVPGLPREVLGLTLLVMVGVVIALLLWVPIGYYSLAGMEFVAAGLLFAWLLAFVRAVAAYAEAPDAGRAGGPVSQQEAPLDALPLDD